MGRYYHTNRFEGKFGFAVQPSDDPALFGMEEQEPSVVNYYLDGSEENIKNVAKTLDEQYEYLRIPDEERIYLLEDGKDDALDKLYSKYFKKLFRAYNKETDVNIIPFHSEVFPEGAVEVFGGVELAWCRIWLGTKIYTELVEDGYCDLEAEL